MSTFTMFWIITTYFDLVKEISKNIAWPLVAIIVTTKYREEIRELMPRVTKAGPGGLEFDPRAQQSSSKPGVDLDNQSLIQKTYIPNSSASIAALEHTLRADLPKFRVEDQVNVLIHELAAARLAAAFEFVLNLIFGSQIEGLKILDERGKVTIDEAKAFFAQYESKYPGFYTAGFEGWLGFLKLQSFVIFDDTDITMTDLGRDFLVFLTRRRVPYSKPF